MKRHPFFLLEVLIAVILVSGFAYMTIQGAFQVIYKQKKLLTEIEDSIQVDRMRMRLIEKYWSQVETIKESFTEEGYQISCQEGKKEKQYLLELKKGKGKPFCYFVSK